MDSATLIKDARQAAALSIRALSERADVAASTVSRIESGKVSPTGETLEKLLNACGRELASEISSSPLLAELADAWNPNALEPDWTRLRSFLDTLAIHPEHRGPATVIEPPRSESRVMDNLLAGIAETISDAVGVRPPAWTKRIAPLRAEWTTPGTPRKYEARRDTTPPRLAKRRLIIDSESLWRDPGSIGL
jgi:transcriptional regulator with XRE-family HTH domain